MPTVRAPAVAGSFYPRRPEALRAALREAYAAAQPVALDAPPVALVAPHAGYVYSGPVAASAYQVLPGCTRVAVLGPSHYVPLRGLAAPSVDAFETPLGRVPVDDDLREAVLAHPAVTVADPPHGQEHSLEVQVPFLQDRLGDLALLPLAVGTADPAAVAAVIEIVWAEPGTLVVVSTDLSHYHDHATARRLDTRTAANVVGRRAAEIGDADACGAVPLRGLVTAARERAMTVTLLDLRTSGDTAGDPGRVVGYGAFAVT